jgi:flagellar P-ring protein precursor FlgI
MVICRTPGIAARADDRFDVTVSTLGTASSLKGGVLYLTALTEPRPGGRAYAIASGKIEIEDPSATTTGKVLGGAQIIRDLPSVAIETGFDLIIDPQSAGWSTAKLLAAVINENAQPQGPAVAFAVDERTVHVEIPEHERAAKAAFLDRTLSAPIPTSLLDLPAQVICNARSGVIVVTGDVEISPGLISHKDLVISTTVPAPTPSVVSPLVERTRYATLDTQNRPKEKAKLSDLLAAFKQLDIPPAQQIEVLQLLHKTGRLHARLVMD